MEPKPEIIDIVVKELDNAVSQLDREIDRLDNRELLFEKLRHTYYEFFEKQEYHEIFMVLNGITTIQDIDEFKKIKDIDGQFDFLFAGKDENMPVWNVKYIKEAFEEAKMEVNYILKKKLHELKSDILLKNKLFSINELENHIKETALSFHGEIMNLPLGLEFYESKTNEVSRKIFNNRLDIIVDRNMWLTQFTRYDGEGNDTPKTFNEYGYPAIFIDREEWANLEFHTLVLEILVQIIEVNPNKTSQHLSPSAHINPLMMPYKIFPSKEAENRFKEILEYYGCFDQTGNTTNRFMPICDAFFTVHQDNQQYFRPLLKKGDYINYLSETFLSREISKLSSGDKYINTIKSDFPSKRRSHD